MLACKNISPADIDNFEFRGGDWPGKIRAILHNRYHVATEDLFTVAEAVLNHRLILNFEAQADGVPCDNVTTACEECERAETREPQVGGRGAA